MKINSKIWLKISLINLFLVACLGLLMRYKIGFEFPYLNQKYLQHSHSHFAFAGWISHTLMVLIIFFLENKLKNMNHNYVVNYNKWLIANLICAYGMLISFIFQGYGFFSITFSTLSIVIALVFGILYFKDLKLLDQEDLVINWFKAALFFNVLSSLGTFALAYMMVNKAVVQSDYFASIYFYLHFQYNGWFFFVCMGLLLYFLQLKKSDNTFFVSFFWLFFVSCFPAYFLSILWVKLPFLVYFLTVISAIIQVLAWFTFLNIVRKINFNSLKNSPHLLRIIFLFIAFALSLKFLLQLGSTIPEISQLAFGFRPIVIAYLHLVLLAITSLFLLFYIFVNQLIAFNKQIRLGLVIFTIGILINEIILAVQGIASFSYTLIPYVNEMLFGAAIILVTGIGIIFIYSVKNVSKTNLV